MFTYSKSTIETLEKGVKHVQNIDAPFTYFSSVSIFNFEQVNAGWELSTHLRMHRENALSNKTQNLQKV